MNFIRRTLTGCWLLNIKPKQNVGEGGLLPVGLEQDPV